MAKYNKSQLYFFKFPNTFFDSDEIEDILKDNDGPSIVILYLKLILIKQVILQMIRNINVFTITNIIH